MKISEDKRKEGLKLAKEFGFKELFVNEKGEFFTNKSYASISVGNDKDKFAEVELGGRTEEKKTNDLDKATDVIAHIEAATKIEVVEAILKAETEGKNRATVVKAAGKKLAVLVEGTKDLKEVKDLEDSKDEEMNAKKAKQ